MHCVCVCVCVCVMQISETHKYNALKSNDTITLNWNLSKIKNVGEFKKASINFCAITVMS
ncbi:hypothetical protein AGMMS49574_16810 [Bacteroidia bacterium]|nr:hypothetical protein AGMMS49574_16810 [Bacteroidia bacterium]